MLRKLAQLGFVIIGVVMISGFRGVSSTNREGVFIYVRELETEEMQFVIHHGDNDELRLNIDSGNCYSIDNTGGLLAVSQRENPQNILIYNLLDGSLFSEIGWSPEWTRTCGFHWINEDTLFISTTFDLTGWTGYSVDVNTTVTSELMDLPYSPVAEDLPNLTPLDPLFMQSPNPDIVLYVRCPTSETIVIGDGREDCQRPPETVIYDLNLQSTVQLLQNAPATFYYVAPLLDFTGTFTWSPSGRYLVYGALYTTFLIYDIVEDVYVDTNASGLDGYYYNFRNGKMQWSPDETRIALLARSSSSDTIGGVHLALYDRNIDEFTVFPTEYVLFPRGDQVWGWMPDSLSVGVILNDGRLIEIGLDGTETPIDDRVIVLYTWY